MLGAEAEAGATLLYLVERAASDHPHLVGLFRQLRLNQLQSGAQVVGQMVCSCWRLSGGEIISFSSNPRSPLAASDALLNTVAMVMAIWDLRQPSC